MDSRCHEKSLSARFGSDALDHLRAAIRATLMAHAQERINGPCAVQGRVGFSSVF